MALSNNRYLRQLSLSDREFLLEDTLVQAVHTIEFLKGCLTDDRYEYKYPEDTDRFLNKVKKLVDMPPLCYHSITVDGCPGCTYRNQRAIRLNMINMKKFLTGKDDE